MPHPGRPTTGTVVLAHGSASPHQRDVVTTLAARAQSIGSDSSADAGPDLWRAAFLDHHGPSLLDAAAELITAGCTRLVVVPALLSNAFHSKVDVPSVVAGIDPLVHVDIAAPIGPDRLLLRAAAMRGVAWDAARTQQGLDGDAVSIVIAAAGTSDADARRAFLDAVDDLVAAGIGAARLEVLGAFIAGGDPDVATAIADAKARGRSPVLVPFLLAGGALRDRAEDQAVAAGSVAVLDALGASDEVVAILRARRDACATV